MKKYWAESILVTGVAFLLTQAVSFSAPGDRVVYTTRPMHDNLSTATQAKVSTLRQSYTTYTTTGRATDARLDRYTGHQQLTNNPHDTNWEQVGAPSQSAFTRLSGQTLSHIYSIQPYGSHPAAGTGDGDIQYNYHGTPSGAVYWKYSSPNLIARPGGKLLFTASGTNRNTNLYNPGTLDNFAFGAFYPTSGTNVGTALQTIPKGTGFSAGIKSQVTVFNTDYVADSTNYESLVLRAGGTSYSINSTKGGTGSAQPIAFQMNNATKMILATDGKVGIGTTTPRSTFDNASSVAGKARATIGSATNYATIDADLGIRLAGNATTWDDLRVEPTARSGAGVGTAPSFAASPWDTLLFNYEFTNGPTAEYLYFNVQMPHRWKEGSSVYPHVHFAPHTTGTGQVDFTIYCSWATPMTGTFGTGSSYTASYNIASNSQYKHLIASNSTAQSMAGMALSSAASCYVSRSMADTYAGSVSAIYLDIHYEVDSMGSDSDYTKSATP